MRLGVVEEVVVVVCLCCVLSTEYSSQGGKAALRGRGSTGDKSPGVVLASCGCKIVQMTTDRLQMKLIG